MDEQYKSWLYALSSPMVALNKEHGASYFSPFFYPDRDFVDMKDDWDIDSRSSLLELVFRMVDNGHAPALSNYYFLYSRLPEHEWRDYCKHQTDYEKILIEFVEQTASECGSGGIRAWDYARMGCLLRNGLTNKYITETECHWLLSRIALRTQYYYTSWNHYIAGWYVGSTYWKSLSIEDLAALRCSLSRWRIAHTLYNLYNDDDSPIKLLSWFTDIKELEKPDSLQEYDWS